jgi:hypothetical protein
MQDCRTNQLNHCTKLLRTTFHPLVAFSRLFAPTPHTAARDQSPNLLTAKKAVMVEAVSFLTWPFREPESRAVMMWRDCGETTRQPRHQKGDQ